MAWTNISNALVSVGALPFATTIQALRDNPIAIANGDAGAPPVLLRSWETSTAGETIRTRIDTPGVGGNIFQFLAYGVIRVRCTARQEGSPDTRIRLFRRRGIDTDQLLFEAGMGSSFNTYTVDVGIIPGDAVFWISQSFGLPMPSLVDIRDQRIFNGGQDLIVLDGSLRQMEGVRGGIR
jgi:hypothetical protein